MILIFYCILFNMFLVTSIIYVCFNRDNMQKKNILVQIQLDRIIVNKYVFILKNQ